MGTTLTARELLEQDEGEDEGGMDNYDQQEDFGGDDEEEEPVQSPKGKGKGKAVPRPAPTPKGKGRALPPVDEEDEIEDDIAQGMQDVEQDASDEEEEEEERAPPKKRIRGTPAPTSQPKRVQVKSRPQKENRDGAFRNKHLP